MEWDGRLITRERAAAIVADHPLQVRIQFRDDYLDEYHLECGRCGYSVLKLGDASRELPPFTMDGLISAVLGHLVMQHGAVLSGGGNK